MYVYTYSPYHERATIIWFCASSVCLHVEYVLYSMLVCQACMHIHTHTHLRYTHRIHSGTRRPIRSECFNAFTDFDNDLDDDNDNDDENNAEESFYALRWETARNKRLWCTPAQNNSWTAPGIGSTHECTTNAPLWKMGISKRSLIMLLCCAFSAHARHRRGWHRAHHNRHGVISSVY